MAGGKKATPDKTRDSILDAALKLFLSKGYDAASMGDICSAAKLTKPTLYYYFSGKSQLLFEVHMRNIKTVLRPHMEKARSIDDPTARLRTLIRDFTNITCSHPELRFLLHGSLTLKDKYSNQVKKEWKQHYELIRDTMEELQSMGIIKAGVKASVATMLVLGMISWITFWFNYGKDASNKNLLREPLSDSKERNDEFADLVEEIVFNGLLERTSNISQGSTAHSTGAGQRGDGTERNNKIVRNKRSV